MCKRDRQKEREINGSRIWFKASRVHGRVGFESLASLAWNLTGFLPLKQQLTELQVSVLCSYTLCLLTIIPQICIA